MGLTVQARIRGSFYGLAIGDAWGYPVEFMSIEAIREQYGPKGLTAPLRTMIAGTPCLAISDDTQMTIAVVEGLIEAGDAGMGAAAQAIGRQFVRWSQSPENNRAPGASCMYGCRQLAQGVAWELAGRVGGRGCGVAMRSAPYGWWFAGRPGPAAHWAYQHGLMTHRDDSACAAGAAVAAGVALAVVGDSMDRVAFEMVRTALIYHTPTGRMLAEALEQANAKASPDTVLDRWRGWCGDEAVAASLFCAVVGHASPHPYIDAVHMAINSPGDSDSLGCITGAIVGAFVGERRVPSVWVVGLERTDEIGRLADRFRPDAETPAARL